MVERIQRCEINTQRLRDNLDEGKTTVVESFHQMISNNHEKAYKIYSKLISHIPSQGRLEQFYEKE